MKTPIRTTAALGLLLCFVLFSAPVFATPKNPIETIKPVLADLTKLLNNPDLQGDVHKTERRKEIMDTIKRGFDFQEMCKRVLGRTWREINDEQRKHFTELMTKLLENAYIGKLEDYHYKKIDYVDQKIQGDRAQVTTTVEKDGQNLPVHYIMQLTPSGWMVYDINIEGVSLVRNYMSQFRSILRTDNFDGLVKIIEKKNESFEKTGKGSDNG